MSHDAAARMLFDNWRATTRIAGLPDAIRPKNRAEGYGIAAAIASLCGQQVSGWKIAATSKAGQRHINVDGPLAGRIFADRLCEAGAEVPLGDNIMRVAEAEFAFRFGEALPPRDAPYENAETMAAVTSLHLAIEVPDSRYTDFTKVGAAQLIADTACASWLVLGPGVEADWRAVDLAWQPVTGLLNGKAVVHGTGEAVLGDPRIALTWLVNEVSSHCGGIAAGQFVTTGTCIVPMAIAAGDRLLMDFGGLGTIKAAIA